MSGNDHDLRRELGLMTEEELADVLGVEIRTLRYWRGQRSGPPFMSFSRNCVPLYRADAVKQWLREREQETQP